MINIIEIIGLILIFFVNILDRIIFYIEIILYGRKNLPLDLRNIGKEKCKILNVPYKEDVKEINEEKETFPFRNARKKEKLISELFPGVTTLNEIMDHVAKKFSKKKLFGSRKIIKLHSNQKVEVVEVEEETEMSVKKDLIEEKKEKSQSKEKIKNLKKVIENWDIPEFEEIKWITYEQTLQRIKNIGKGISKLTKINSFDRLAIFENTCIEWMLMAHSCFRYNIPVVTVYSTLGESAVEDALNESEVKVLFTNEEMLSKIENMNIPNVDYVIYNKSFPHDLEKIEKIEKKIKKKIISFEDVEKVGEDDKEEENIKQKSKKDDIALIMYTSGTTGKPKGVVLSHDNIVTGCAALTKQINFHPKDDQRVYIAYLPLAHILEILAETHFISVGGSIGYGSSKTLFDKGAKPFGDLTAIRPTLICGVPRVYDTLRKSIVSLINDDKKTSGLKRFMFNCAYEAKLKALKLGFDTPIWNAIVFKSLRNYFGGRCELLLSGGAAINPKTHLFVRVCFGCSVVQGYGLTETCAATTLQAGTYPFTEGKSGQIVPCCELKLESVPDMNYHAKNLQGEILLKGRNVFKGYFKDDKKTKESIDDNGWFHTGDIGQIDKKTGDISIIDRKKNLIKLSHGEYVALEKLESTYINSPFIAPNGICVFGDMYHINLVALIVVEREYFKKFCIEKGFFKEEEYVITRAIKNENVIKAVYEDLVSQAKNAKLEKFEFLSNIYLVPDEWSPANGLLTSAFKLRRSQIAEKYASEIKNLYSLNKFT